MQRIELTTHINAPIQRCFALSLSIDFHLHTSRNTGEQVIGGVSSGQIGPGQRVRWRGRHFGLWLTHEVEITEYQSPVYFKDVQTRGHFRRYEHAHYFTPTPTGGTVMRDELLLEAPFGPIGRLAERALLLPYFVAFIRTRNAELVAALEGEGWRRFVGPVAPAGN